MELYLINNKNKAELRSPNKPEPKSGLVKLVDSAIRTMTDRTSYLVRTAGNCEEIHVQHGTDSDTAKKQFGKIITKTIAKNAALFAVNSTITVVTYIPPLTFIPWISMPFAILAANNISLIAGARKGAEKAEFARNEEVSILEEMLKHEKKTYYDFQDGFLQKLYTAYSKHL